MRPFRLNLLCWSSALLKLLSSASAGEGDGSLIMLMWMLMMMMMVMLMMLMMITIVFLQLWSSSYPGALRAQGLLLADGVPTVGWRKTFCALDESPHKNDRNRNSETTKRKRDPKVPRMGKGLIWESQKRRVEKNWPEKAKKGEKRSNLLAPALLFLLLLCLPHSWYQSGQHWWCWWRW